MSEQRSLLDGIAWNGVARGVRVVLQFATFVILARLLDAEDFGLVAMITVLTNFVTVFSEFGLAAALIHQPELREGHRSSTFWLTLAIGVLLVGITWAAAPWISLFYSEPRLAPLARGIALNFAFVSLRVVQTAILTREMRFRALGSTEIIATAIGSGLGIGMAFAGYGVWSLVAQMLVTAAIETIGFWMVSGWHPRLQFEIQALKELLPYGVNLTGFSVINYWVRNADNLLIGRFVGSAGLGIYDRAYRSMQMPLSHVTGVMTRVMFPALSRLQSDSAAVKRLYIRVVRSISLLTFPMMIGLLVAADGFVLTLLGAKWAEVVPVLRVLCVVGLVQSVSGTTGWLYQSQGRTDVLLRWGLFSGAVTIVAFAIGIQWGVMGVAVAYLLRTLALTPLSFMIPGRFVGLRVGEVFAALRGTVYCALAMGAVMIATRLAFPVGFPAPALLVSQVMVGFGSYAVFVYIARLEAYRDTLQAVNRYRASRVPG